MGGRRLRVLIVMGRRRMSGSERVDSWTIAYVGTEEPVHV